MTAQLFAPADLNGLPDPVREPEFYRGVTVKRGLAWIVDAGAILLLCLLALPLTAFTALFWWPVLWLVVEFAYRWATLSNGSATLGMRLMALTVRSRDGQRLDPATACAHVAGYTVSMTLFPLQVVSVALMFVLGRGQGLTDLVLGTAVLNRPAR